ncbi:MAG: aspartate aminotransferase family protein [bacterium]|nr:aspartate aminotransferase family protein [bacterium]
MTQAETIAIEQAHTPPFFTKLPISIERGEGIYAWDQNEKKYLDFTAGWGVTSLGHAHPVIVEALTEQSRKMIQTPSAGLTYSPVRAKLLALMQTILPENLTHIFFGSSGAEANDASMKLARKITGRTDIISTLNSFHGRTMSTASATGQAKHRDRFTSFLVPNFRFVPFDDLDALANELDRDVAAVLLEPIQGEGGVNVPSEGYLAGVSDLCRKHGALLIVDEIQTGFCRTGSMFAIDGQRANVDFLTMAKGIAGGFPISAFAMSGELAAKVETGDHGGTYCGNPLGCAVADAVIRYLIEHDICNHVQKLGASVLKRLEQWQTTYPSVISNVRGKGLLLAMEISNPEIASAIYTQSIDEGLLLNLTRGKVIRIFPALTITEEEAEEGLNILGRVIERMANA